VSDTQPQEERYEPGESQEELDRVPIRDNGEPLVDFLQVCPELVFSPVHPVFEFPRVHLVRQSVAEMLCQAARALPKGLRLQIVEGYRPMSVQWAMFKYWLERGRREHPDWSDQEVKRMAMRFSAPPDAPSPPPHLTGGAVDLEIIDESGQRLDFTSPYELTDPRQAAPLAAGLSDTAQRDRALLRSVLEPTGLTNYVAEWWHWSYGDSGWALRVGADHALYGLATLPPDAEWVGDMSKMPREQTNEG